MIYLALAFIANLIVSYGCLRAVELAGRQKVFEGRPVLSFVFYLAGFLVPFSLLPLWAVVFKAALGNEYRQLFSFISFGLMTGMGAAGGLFHQYLQKNPQGTTRQP